jgi:hypothetical protein
MSSHHAHHALIAWTAAILLSAGVAAAAPAKKPSAKKPPAKTCCTAPAGTVVAVELAQEVSTKAQKAGDSVDFRLTQPLVAQGQILAPAGAKVTGVVVESAKPGYGGKGAKLVLSARAIERDGASVPLQGLQLSAGGKSTSNTANVAGLAGMAFAPLGFVGLAVKGGDVVFPTGTPATAKLASSVVLPPLGPAPAGAQPVVQASDTAAPGAIDIPPPPTGQGQVVFFRKKALLGMAQWFDVREGGKPIGKLTNGVYFIQQIPPGLHEYSAKDEPEFKDRLRLQIDPGETYFVEGTLAKGVVLGTADIAPSDRGAFNAASKELKPAAAPKG